MAFEFNTATYAFQRDDEGGPLAYGLFPEAVHIIFGTDEAGGDSTQTNVRISPPITGMRLEYAVDEFDDEEEQGVVDLKYSGALYFYFNGDIELGSFIENLEAVVHAYRNRNKPASDPLIMDE